MDSMPGMDAHLAAQSVVVDHKTELNQFCQKYCKRPVTKQDIVYVVNKFGAQYQSIVKLNCFAGQEYAGHLSLNAKDAEKSAAHQALMAYAPTIEKLSQEDDKKSRRKVHQQLTPEELAEKRARQAELGENPAITPKTKLNSLCMKISKRYLHKGETVYESQKVTGGYQATVKLAALPGEWSGRAWAGEVCATKQKAEQSAAEIALQQILSDPDLVAEADRPKGRGKGNSEKGRGKGYWAYTGWVWQEEGADVEAQGPQRVSDEPLMGDVLEWKEHFGWLRPHAAIDHPAASLRGGKVYVHKKDLPEGVDALPQGATVQFYLYEDPWGLGAEHLTLL